MDQEQIENTIQFLVDNQAKFHSDLELMKEAQQETTAQIQALAQNQQKTDERILSLTERVDDIVGAVDVMRLELREAFDNLIVGNEVTRNLTEQVTKLAINTSQRVTRLEEENGNQ